MNCEEQNIYEYSPWLRDTGAARVRVYARVSNHGIIMINKRVSMSITLLAHLVQRALDLSVQSF